MIFGAAFSICATNVKSVRQALPSKQAARRSASVIFLAASAIFWAFKNIEALTSKPSQRITMWLTTRLIPSRRREPLWSSRRGSSRAVAANHDVAHGAQVCGPCRCGLLGNLQDSATTDLGGNLYTADQRPVLAHQTRNEIPLTQHRALVACASLLRTTSMSRSESLQVLFRQSPMLVRRYRLPLLTVQHPPIVVESLNHGHVCIMFRP